jgi:primosomal protein N'
VSHFILLILSFYYNHVSARECDEKVAAEVKAALSTGVLKNHRNETFTRLSRSTARTTHAYKKARQTRQKKKALSVVDQELESLKAAQKENSAKIKLLKANKTSIIGKATSSKAESSSSGKATGASKRAKAKTASKVASIKKGMEAAHPYLLHFVIIMNLDSYFRCCYTSSTCLKTRNRLVWN